VSKTKKPWVDFAHGLCPPYEKTIGVEGWGTVPVGFFCTISKPNSFYPHP